MSRVFCSLLLLALAIITSWNQSTYDGRLFSKEPIVQSVIELPIYLDQTRVNAIINAPSDYCIEIGGINRPTLWLDKIFANNNITGVLAAVYIDGFLDYDTPYRLVQATAPLPECRINPDLAVMLSTDPLSLKIDNTTYSLQLFNNTDLFLPLVSKYNNKTNLTGGLIAKTYTTLYTVGSINYLKVRLYIRNESLVGNSIIANPIRINELSITGAGPMGIKASDIKDVRYDSVSNSFILMRNGYLSPLQGLVYDIVLAAPNGTMAQYMMAYASFADEITACPNSQAMIDAGLFTPIGGPYPQTKTFLQAQQFINTFLTSIRDRGPFSSTGDTKIAATTGTPRNKLGSLWAKWLIQSEYSQIVPALEKFCLGQAARPMIRSLNDIPYSVKNDDLYSWDGLPHFSASTEWARFGLHPDQTDPFGAPIPAPFDYSQYNGWSGWEYEHWHNTDIFVYYMLTGDKWALEELESYATNLILLLKFPPSNYYTRSVMAERSEGWTMIGAKYIVMAIKDKSHMGLELEDHMFSRIQHIKNTMASYPQYGGDVLPQFGDARRWPSQTHYSVCWQVGSLSTGFFFWGENQTGLDVIKRVKDHGLDLNGIPFQYYDLDGVLPGIPNADGLDIFIVPALCYAHHLLPQDGLDTLARRIVGSRIPDNDSRIFLDFIYMVGR